MDINRARLGEVVWRGDLKALEPSVIRLVSIMATLVAIVLATLYLATGDARPSLRLLPRSRPWECWPPGVATPSVC